MKKLICFLSLSLVLASCSSDDSTETIDNSGSTLFVQKTVEGTGASATNTFYSYNGNKIVSAINEDGDGYYYTYTGDLITKAELKRDDVAVETEYYEYDANQRLISFRSISVSAMDAGFKTLYTYNADGTVGLKAYSGSRTSQTNLDSTSIAYFENGEVVKITSPDYPTLNYTYDGKNNPFKNVLGFDKISYDESQAVGMAQNVVTSNDWEEPNDVTDTTTYTYNDSNYPLTQTIRGYKTTYSYE